MQKIIQPILSFFEKYAFGVCAWWADRLGLKNSEVRKSFIYVSFITLGSPILVYLIMVFILKHKRVIKFWSKRKTVWDL